MKQIPVAQFVPAHAVQRRSLICGLAMDGLMLKVIGRQIVDMRSVETAVGGCRHAIFAEECNGDVGAILCAAPVPAGAVTCLCQRHMAERFRPACNDNTDSGGAA